MNQAMKIQQFVLCMEEGYLYTASALARKVPLRKMTAQKVAAFLAGIPPGHINRTTDEYTNQKLYYLPGTRVKDAKVIR